MQATKDVVLPIANQPTAAVSMPTQWPTVRGLEKIWNEIQQRPLWAPPNFWRYLQLRYQMRLKLLNPKDSHVLIPTGKINDCSSCLDNCCIGPRSTVLLRLRDIAHLIDMNCQHLISAQKPSFSAEQLQQRPALRRQVYSRSWAIFPVLKQNSFGACAALDAHGHCTIHPHWPLSCERFPYALDLDPQEIIYSPRCRSFWIHPKAKQHASAMSIAAVSAYNERIKDMILLSYCQQPLQSLGLTQYLRLDNA